MDFFSAFAPPFRAVGLRKVRRWQRRRLRGISGQVGVAHSRGSLGPLQEASRVEQEGADVVNDPFADEHAEPYRGHSP